MEPNISILSRTVCLIASVPGFNNLRGSNPLPTKSFPSSIYLRTSAVNASWHSVLTLILHTPMSMDFFTISSGIPVPPWSTNGRCPVALRTASKVSKLSPAQFSGYFPWIFPIPAANRSIPVSAISLHSSGSAHSPAASFPSSSGSPKLPCLPSSSF